MNLQFLDHMPIRNISNIKNINYTKLFIFVITAIISGVAGALYYPQAGIINPAELAPIASIYLAVWVAIGGRGYLYGALIGAAFVSLASSYFTGGQIPNIIFGILGAFKMFQTSTYP